MLKRRLTSLLVIASLAGTAAVAEAAVTKGTYSGKFKQGGTVSLTVKSQTLIKIVRKKMKFKCSDGDAFISKTNTANGTIDVADGDFDVKDSNENDGDTWKMTGTWKGSKVTGTYRHTATFNAENELDPDGAISCTTGDMTYSAKRPKKK